MTDSNASKPNTFFIDDREIDIREGESIFRAARRLDIKLPHLCYSPKPGYRATAIAASAWLRSRANACSRELHPSARAGHEGQDIDDRAKTARKMVAELLLTDQPAVEVAHDNDSEFWKTAKRQASLTAASPSASATRAGAGPQPSGDGGQSRRLHPVQSLRPRLPRSAGQRRHRHGRPWPSRKIVFDFDDPMGNSTCVACGECVQACPTGALMPATMVDENNVYLGKPDRTVDSVCPYCGVGCQLTYQIKNDKIVAVTGQNGPANANRLCVKGRFGFDYVANPQRLMKPMIRKDGVAKVPHEEIDPSNPWTHFREATWKRRSIAPPAV